VLKLAVTVAAVGVGAAALIWSASSFLSVDDLKDCVGPDVTSPKCAPADVIIAISGGDTHARTAEAVKLYKAGWAPKLIFSGAALDSNGPSNAEAMKTQAVNNGVPATDIILDKTATDTAQNATGTLALLDNRDKRVILVTSPYHQRRASVEFQHAFGTDIDIVNHPTPNDRNWGPHWWMTASGWAIALTETIKTLVVSAWR
jgi:uncharacterized SAM-binding protein YcdF (DUF218 family)